MKAKLHASSLKLGRVFMFRMPQQLITHKFVFTDSGLPRTGIPVVNDVDKISERIEVNRHVSSRSIVLKLMINHKTVLNHLFVAGFKKKLEIE